jgi:hypothetical protein
MGSGRRFYCEKCGYDFLEFNGIGFLYPNELREAIKDGKEGKLGKEVKEFFKMYPNGTLNYELATYICKGCGIMKNEAKYTMYAPKEGITDLPNFCMPHELREWYTVYKRFPHKCNECGGSMKMLTANAKPKCPRCGNILKTGINDICWD